MKAAASLTEAIEHNRYFYIGQDLYIGQTELSRAGCQGFYWLDQYVNNERDTVTTTMIVDDFGNLRCRPVTNFQ